MIPIYDDEIRGDAMTEADMALAQLAIAHALLRRLEWGNGNCPICGMSASDNEGEHGHPCAVGDYFGRGS